MKKTKGCINKDCLAYKNKRMLFNRKYRYCPICGEPLVVICEKCWRLKEDEHAKYCDECTKELNNDRRYRNESINNRIKVTKDFVLTVGPHILKHKDDIKKSGCKIISKVNSLKKVKAC